MLHLRNKISRHCFILRHWAKWAFLVKIGVGEKRLGFGQDNPPIFAPEGRICSSVGSHYHTHMADVNILEFFDNPNGTDENAHPFLIEHIAEEFTSVCPVTGHPDFGTVVLRYIPGKTCVELKSLKLYYQAFRNEGIYYEAVTNCIAKDLNEAMNPIWLQVQTQWKGRGGIRSDITVEYGKKP